MTRQNLSPILPSDMHIKEDYASDMIYNLLLGDKPCMIARFGSFELATALNGLDVRSGKHDYWGYLTNRNQGWWWNPKLLYHMKNNTGFFPITEDALFRYSDRMMLDLKELDVLGSFSRLEFCLAEELKNVQKVPLDFLEPFRGSRPWTRALKGKNVLVVHPLAKLISKQYNENRKSLFANDEFLPEFNLYTLEAVQSLGGKCDGFNDWFEALQWMEDEIDKIDYDICLIGCGAYGFCLAAHVKRQGKKAVHLGGVLQLLFGIKGKRWTEYRTDKDFYLNFMNDSWVYPTEEYRPKNANNVEGSCYW